MRREFLAAATAMSLCIGVVAYAKKAPADIQVIGNGTHPVLCSDASGNLHLVYESAGQGTKGQDIFYSESTDGGKTWHASVDVSNTPGVSSHPSLAVEKSGALDVVWSDTSPGEKTPDIYFSRSTDSGKTWSAIVDIAETPGRSTDPCVAVGADNSLHVLWCDTSTGEKNQDVYYTYSTDGGKKWGEGAYTPAKDISSTPGASSEPVLVVDDAGVVHGAWVDTTSGKERPDVFYTRLTGGSWTKPVNVSNTTGKSTHPAMDCAKGKVFLAWSENSLQDKNPDIWCSVAGADGKFGKAFNVANSPGVSTGPAIAADNQDRVALVWSDTASGDNKPDIFGRISFDGLTNVSKLLDISNSESLSKSVDVTTIGDKIFIAWEELVNGKFVIATKSMETKGTSTGPVGGDYLRL